VRFTDPNSYVGWGFLSLAGSTLPDWSRGRNPKRTAPGPPEWGLGDGPITHPCKTALDYRNLKHTKPIIFWGRCETLLKRAKYDAPGANH